jgi:hypothetical protein
LYFIESYKHGVNLFAYYFKLGDKNQPKQNYEIVQNEDSDVSQERNLITNSNIDVNKSKLFLFKI